MRIGIYGGSFNPVHNGHVHLARTAAADFALDRVYFVPSRISMNMLRKKTGLKCFGSFVRMRKNLKSAIMN